jgi:hypothetical protein
MITIIIIIIIIAIIVLGLLSQHLSKARIEFNRIINVIIIINRFRAGPDLRVVTKVIARGRGRNRIHQF